MAINFDKHIADLSELKQVYTARAKETLMSSLKEFFSAHPEVTAVAWPQYTPYFNDGEPCEFGVYEPELKVKVDSLEPDIRKYIAKNDEELTDDYELDYNTDVYSAIKYNTNAGYYSEKRPATAAELQLLSDFNEVKSLLQSSSLDEAMKMTFGDGVRVIATPDGFETEDYDHG